MVYGAWVVTYVGCVDLRVVCLMFVCLVYY